MHFWHGKRAEHIRGIKLGGSWRVYRRRVLWIGSRYFGVQSRSSPLPRFD
jgi:hypothetical protein